jgi:hypothetical protein
MSLEAVQRASYAGGGGTAFGTLVAGAAGFSQGGSRGSAGTGDGRGGANGVNLIASPDNLLVFNGLGSAARGGGSWTLAMAGGGGARELQAASGACRGGPGGVIDIWEHNQ